MRNWKENKKLLVGVITLILALLGGGGYYTVNQGGEIVSNSSSPVVESIFEQEAESQTYFFRSESLLQSHYEKHGIDMGFASAQEYETAAAAVISHPDVLHKIEAEDGDDVYYVEATNEFVVVSKDGYIRTYFNPGGGIDYYNRQ
ncbi:MAG: hypothetical protein IJ327_06185 [Lachnospiraceae bacterium]|nr:hypothetical protein [Lachnospiraceae bacterium]